LDVLSLKPFVVANEVPFTANRQAVIARLGPPGSEVRNDIGLTALDFGSMVLRFQDCGRLEEMTCRADAVLIGGVYVPFRLLAGFVRKQDEKSFERAGFLVSPQLGLAFVPSDPPWVTALAWHCLPQWYALPED